MQVECVTAKKQKALFSKTKKNGQIMWMKYIQPAEKYLTTNSLEIVLKKGGLENFNHGKCNWQYDPVGEPQIQHHFFNWNFQSENLLENLTIYSTYAIFVPKFWSECSWNLNGTI